ncbi:MAG: hypothetical protein JRN33_07895 [Nitrososphaerota archaeon]|jgi:hypothetical protein|nr:hypothetical protein [Nitrososphaerota archaeon]
MPSDILENAAVQVVEAASQPVTADYVAFHLGVAWNTAKTVLLELAISRRVRATRTSRGWIFAPAEAPA